MKFYEDPVYIKMCRKAEEIQDIASPLYKPKIHGDYKMEIDEDGDFWIDGCWIPRLDQLIDLMVGEGNGYNGDPLAHLFCEFIEDQRDHNERINIRSWEKLLLAWVMKEKHGKRWTGKEWEVTP